MAETPPHEPQVVRDLHERMVRIRLFETEAGKLMEAGKLPGFLHLYVGQEAVAAGVMAALRDDDHTAMSPGPPSGPGLKLVGASCC